MNAPHVSSTSTTTTAPSGIGGRRTLVRTAGWSVFTVSLLMVFTLLKLPEARLKNLIQGTIASALAPRGIAFSAKESGISLGFGLGVRLEGVEIAPPPPQPTVSIDRIDLSPAIFGLVFGDYGGRFRIKNAGGTLSGTVRYNQKTGLVTADVDADDFDLGKTNLVGAASGVEVSALLNGDIALKGDPTLPNTLTGGFDLTLSKISMKQQKIAGFPLPPIQAETGRIKIDLQSATARIQELTIGRPKSSDDLYLHVTGEAKLGKNWESTGLALETQFGFSPATLKPLALVEALIAPGKQDDGLYAYTVSGTVLSPTPIPQKKAAAGK